MLCDSCAVVFCEAGLGLVCVMWVLGFAVFCDR